MKRFRMWVFTSIAMISLVLFLAAAVFWMRSYQWWDGYNYEFSRVTPTRTIYVFLTLTFSRGDVYLAAGKGAGARDPGAKRSTLNHFQRPPIEIRLKEADKTVLEQLGFRFYTFTNSGTFWANGVLNSHDWSMDLTFPLWFAAGVLCVLPLWRWIPLLFRRRTIPGTCSVCGYDLRATPDRCPECGTAPAKG